MEALRLAFDGIKVLPSGPLTFTSQKLLLKDFLTSETTSWFSSLDMV